MLNRARLKVCTSCSVVKTKDEFPTAGKKARKCGTVVTGTHSICNDCIPSLNRFELRNKNIYGPKCTKGGEAPLQGG